MKKCLKGIRVHGARYTVHGNSKERRSASYNAGLTTDNRQQATCDMQRQPTTDGGPPTAEEKRWTTVNRERITVNG